MVGRGSAQHVLAFSLACLKAAQRQLQGPRMQQLLAMSTDQVSIHLLSTLAGHTDH